MTQLISNLSQLTAVAMEEFRKAVQTPIPNEELRKAGVTQSTGLVAYDLQAPAKQLFPVLTPLRNVIPRVPGGIGTATNWKRVTGINTLALRGFVPEGTRNGVVTTAVDDKSASYKALGLEDSVTFEAELAGQGFENVRATQAQRLLWATMIEEELADLGANLSVTLGTPTAPTVSVVDGGGTIADDAGGYVVRVVALTLHGYLASSLANGVVGLVSVTPADGSTPFTYGGGSSLPSDPTNSGAVANGGDSAIQAYTPIVAGAVAYAWYVGAHDGNVTLQAITLINSVELTSLATTHQNVTAITADNSKNTLGYDGILYHAWTSGSGAYIKNLATGTPGSGTGLTSDGVGGIVEIDEALESLWENYKLTPTMIYVNVQEAKNITKKVLASSGMTYNVSLTAGQELTAGAVVMRYLNKFGMGNTVVPIRVHPYLPAGTMTGLCEQLPYPINGVPNVFEKRLRRDYYQIEWPLRTRKYESGVYFDGVLAHYYPPSMFVITNIADK